MATKDSYNITAADVAAIMESREAVASYIRTATDKHYAKIAYELGRFGTELSPISRVRHAIVFSIMSPKCPIEKNTVVTPILLDAIMRDASRDELRDIILSHGIGLQNDKADRLHANAQFLRELTSSDVTRDALYSLAGIGMKTASMAMALYDENAPVYTLDTHMWRWMRAMAGLDPAMGTHAAADGRYRVIEAWLLDIVRDTCADVPVFLTQWAVWNEWGFAGEHQCHLPIFGIAS